MYFFYTNYILVKTLYVKSDGKFKWNQGTCAKENLQGNLAKETRKVSLAALLDRYNGREIMLAVRRTMALLLVTSSWHLMVCLHASRALMTSFDVRFTLAFTVGDLGYQVGGIVFFNLAARPAPVRGAQGNEYSKDCARRKSRGG